MMFTKEEALSFLEKKLKIQDVEEKTKTNRRHLLDEIVVRMQTLPFSNLRLLSKPPEERRRPSIEETKADLLSGIGGLCYNMNVGLYFLLKAIGFEASMALSAVTTTKINPFDHVVVYIDNLEKPGDRFLAEAGLGRPAFRVFDLSFEKESPEYRDSFIEYKLVKHEGKLLRMHRKGCPFRDSGPHGEADLYIGDWRRFVSMEPESSTRLEDFDKYFDEVFTNPNLTSFHSMIYIQAYLSGKSVVINKESLLLENDNGDLEKTAIEGGDKGVVATVQKYFPAIPEQLVRDALLQLSKSKSE